MDDPNNILGHNLAEASEVFVLKQQVENAKTMLSELKRQRDSARDDLHKLSKQHSHTISALRDCDSALLHWYHKPAWDKFWSAGPTVYALWDTVARALNALQP